MVALRSASIYLLTLVLLSAVTTGCTPTRSAPPGDGGTSCRSTAESLSQRAEMIRIPRPTRTQSSRSFSGGPPSAATRIVWITPEDSCL